MILSGPCAIWKIELSDKNVRKQINLPFGVAAWDGGSGCLCYDKHLQPSISACENLYSLNLSTIAANAYWSHGRLFILLM